MTPQALIFSVSLALLATEAVAQRQSTGEISLSDEVHIKQETGKYTFDKSAKPHPAASKMAPEGTTANTTTPAGATSPNTCDPKNATSQSCYTATQQGHK